MIVGTALLVIRLGVSVLIVLVLAGSVGGCGDGAKKSSTAHRSSPPATATEPQEAEGPATAVPARYTSEVRAAWKRLNTAIAGPKDTFNSAQTPDEVRRGLAGYERVLGAFADELAAAGPPPTQLTQRHEQFLRLTRSLAAIYGAMRGKARGSVGQLRAAIRPGMDRIAQVGPRWATAGDALLNAL